MIQLTPLSKKHLGEVHVATERALQQWAKGVFAPTEIVAAMERILLFLRQHGGASQQARQVTSLAFIIGEQVVQLAGWSWVSASDDGSLNPAVVSADQTRVLPVIDVMTLLVTGEARSSLASLVRACVDATPHPLIVTLAPATGSPSP